MQLLGVAMADLKLARSGTGVRGFAPEDFSVPELEPPPF